LGEHVGLAHVPANGGCGTVAEGVPVRPFVQALLVACSAVLFVTGASAHDQSFSYADLRWEREQIRLEVTVHRDDAAPALGIGVPESLMTTPVLGRESGRLFGLVTSRIRVSGDQRDLLFRLEGVESVPDQHAVRIKMTASLPGPVSRVHVAGVVFPEVSQHETFLNVYSAGGKVLLQEVLTAEHAEVDVYETGTRGILVVIGTFIKAGIHHIYIGPDHILFIIGLLLLGGGLGRVLRLATAFTIAHSITLALAVLGVVRVPGRIIEPMIALSLVYVGIENLRAGPRAADWRTRVAFAFGLIHGFGFASVLREFGLPHQALAWSLMGFNLGVEVGQASIVFAVVPLLGAFRMILPRAASRAVAAASCGIVFTGGVWFLQRAFVG
jgi:hydrogenase/urease accessory protein HupE